MLTFFVQDGSLPKHENTFQSFMAGNSQSLHPEIRIRHGDETRTLENEGNSPNNIVLMLQERVPQAAWGDRGSQCALQHSHIHYLLCREVQAVTGNRTSAVRRLEAGDSGKAFSRSFHRSS